MQAPESKAAERGLASAGPLEEASGLVDVLRYTLALHVERPELGAAPQVAAIAGPAEESGSARGILFDPRSLPVQHAKSRAPFEPAKDAALVEQGGRACGVAFDASAALIRDTEPRACITDVLLARLSEELGRAGVILQDVFALLKLDRELTARRGLAGIAGGVEALRLRIARVTCRERDGGRDQKTGQKSTNTPARVLGGEDRRSNAGTHGGAVAGGNSHLATLRMDAARSFAGAIRLFSPDCVVVC
jgi:hypothetical protein